MVERSTSATTLIYTDLEYLEEMAENTFFEALESFKGTLDQEILDIFHSFRDTANVWKGLGREWFIEHLGYSGFDVLKFRELIRKKAGADLREIAFIIMIFLIRGNNIDRIIETTSSKVAVTKLTNSKKVYSIKNKAEGKTMNVTMSRLAIAFPELVGLILHTIPDLPGPVSLEQIRTVVGYDEFPAVARQSSMACILPKDGKSTEILNTFLLANLMISEVINSSNKKWAEKRKALRIAETRKYIQNGYDSKLLSQDVRVTICKELLILTDKGEYTTVWQTAAVKAKEVILRYEDDKISF